MERKTTKKVAEPRENGFFREVTIELIQHYNDSTKKLVKTEEGSRIEGRYFREAQAGESPVTQLMNSDTFDVMSLVEVAATAVTGPVKTPKTKVAVKKPESAYTKATEVVEKAKAVAKATGKPVIFAAQGSGGKGGASVDGADGADGADGQPGVVTFTVGMDVGKGSDSTVVTTIGADGVIEQVETLDGEEGMASKKNKNKKVKAVKAVKEPKPSGNGETKAVEKAVDLNKKKLNDKETKVFSALASSKEALSIVDLATAAFHDKPSRAKANSWVRNSLRRLVHGALAAQESRGSYKLTAKGKNYDPKKVAKTVDAAKAD